MNKQVKRVLIGMTLAFGVSNCDRPQAKVSDEYLQKILTSSPGITHSCLEKIRFGGIEAMPDRVDQCFEMTKPQRWIGLWTRDFELSRFCPAPALQCSRTPDTDIIWLTLPASARHATQRLPTSTYRIEFLGRRTLLPGHHGHMGMSGHEIVVDRVISLSPMTLSDD